MTEQQELSYEMGSRVAWTRDFSGSIAIVNPRGKEARFVDRLPSKQWIRAYGEMQPCEGCQYNWPLRRSARSPVMGDRYHMHVGQYGMVIMSCSSPPVPNCWAGVPITQ